MSSLSASLLFLALFLVCYQVQADTLPIIGILSIPSEIPGYPADSWSYSPSSYAKNFESGGAQVVPLQYDMPRHQLESLLDRLNGVVFHGGDADMIDAHGNLTPLGETMDFVVKYVIEQNKNGNYYPIWGTCMGFQGFACLIQGNWSILTQDCVGCSGVNHNNYFDESYQSKLYAGLPQDLRDAMPTNNISVFSHFWDFHWDTFLNSAPLNQILKPVTYAFDNKGLKYVSSYESPSWPIYPFSHGKDFISFENGVFKKDLKIIVSVKFRISKLKFSPKIKIQFKDWDLPNVEKNILKFYQQKKKTGFQEKLKQFSFKNFVFKIYFFSFILHLVRIKKIISHQF